jgi:hypothetical protein
LQPKSASCTTKSSSPKSRPKEKLDAIAKLQQNEIPCRHGWRRHKRRTSLGPGDVGTALKGGTDVASETAGIIHCAIVFLLM